MRPIVNVPETDRATDIGNMQKKLVKIARVVPEISTRTDRQTDRQTYSSQYFATAPAGQVIVITGNIIVTLSLISFSLLRFFMVALWNIGQNIILSCCGLLWSPYVIGQTIIFLPCGFFLSSIYLLSFSIPRLITAAAGWMSTIL